MDNIEIMRDLSTYECNFAENTYNSTCETFRERMDKMLERVKEVKKMTGQNVKFDEDGDPYFTDSSLSFRVMEEGIESMSNLQEGLSNGRDL